MRKTIAVAMATYNGERFLRQQLDSIFGQTVLPDFISVSDDGSTDETVNILREYQARANIPMMLNINQEKVGVVRNFNIAFGQCQTEYIIYCDQDDVWRRDKLEAYLDVLGRPGVALVYHKSKIVDSELNEIDRPEPFNVPYGRYAFPSFPDYIWGFGHQMIFSRATFEKLKEIQHSTQAEVASIGLNLDRALLLAAGMVGDIHFIDKSLILFRRHDGSVSDAGKRPKITYPTCHVDERLAAIIHQRNLISELLVHMESYGDSESPQRSIYNDHLRKLLVVYSLRFELYGAKEMLTKACAYAKLLLSGAYGDVRNNKIPIRHLVLDAARVFRP